MFNRIPTETLPLPLPKEWNDELKNNLLKIYGEQAINDDFTFGVYTYTYPEEVLLIVSYMPLELTSPLLPQTLMLSANLSSQTEKPLDVFHNLIDRISHFFDYYFMNRDQEEFDEYVYDWQEETLEDCHLFYKFTREHIELTLKAEELLSTDS